MKSNVHIEGLGELSRMLRKAPREIRRAFGAEVVVPTAFAVEAKAKRAAPVQTGALMGDIHVRIKSDTEAEVRSGDAIGYAVYVHEGTRYMSGRPYLGNAARMEEAAYTSRLRRFADDLPERLRRL